MKNSPLKLAGTWITAVLFLIFSQGILSQTTVNLSVSQPPELVADAGNDAAINAGNNIVIGGSPTASGGVSPYSYYWNWASYINSRTIANPVATPPGTLTFNVIVSDNNGCTDSDEVTITVIGGTGLTEIKSGIRFNIFPNPTSGSFTICIDNITRDQELKIAVISLSGQRVYEETFAVKARFEEEINMSYWPRGYYIISIDGESTHLTKQLILH